jgi:hypothetical protein
MKRGDAHIRVRRGSGQEVGVIKSAVMLLVLASMFLATGCLDLFVTKHEPAREAETAECAGLSGQVRVDCERRYHK